MDISVIMLCIMKFGKHELLSYPIGRLGIFANDSKTVLNKIQRRCTCLG